MLTKDFILAGKAVFTVWNPTGEHHTYRVTQKEFPDKKVLSFISVLVGPDNTKQYAYMGVVDRDFGTVHLTPKSKLERDDTRMRVAAWVLRRIWNKLPLPEGYKLEHAGRCGRCGKKLTHPESLETGLGPECARRGGNHKMVYVEDLKKHVPLGNVQ